MTEENESTAWTKLAAPLPSSAISWRQDGKPTQRDGKWTARFVCYVEAGTVRERLDSVVPGEWNLSMEPLPAMPYVSEEDNSVSFKARLNIMGVIREDVGTGKDYKSAATDAFKRAAVRFGIGHELYAMEQNWVAVDGDGKFAKPLEDPQTAYERRYGNGAIKAAATVASPAPREGVAPEPTGGPNSDTDAASCPKCGGHVWDNRLTKKNPRAPDYKCQNRSCDGVIWPPRGDEKKEPAKALTGTAEGPYDFEDFPGALVDQSDDLPF